MGCRLSISIRPRGVDIPQPSGYAGSRAKRMAIYYGGQRTATCVWSPTRDRRYPVTTNTLHRRILVTGSGGQLGGALCGLMGGDAVGMDLPELDITDREAVHGAVDRLRPEIVINAAAYTHVDRAESEPDLCYAVNVIGVENLVDACRQSGASIVQVSTDYVFDGRQASPYCESDRPNPLNAYGRSKWEAEQVVAQYPQHLIIRTAGLFGRGGSTAAGNFVDTMLRLADQGHPLRVVNDQTTSFTYAGDLALAIRALLVNGTSGLFHLSNSGSASWYQLAAEAFRLAGLRPQIEPVPMAEYPCAAERPRFSVLNTEKHGRTRGCHRMPSWQHALSEYLARCQVRSSC